MRRYVFWGNMLRYGYMPLCGILLSSLLNWTVVRGGEAISAAIDCMFAGEHIAFAGFMAELAVLTVLGFASAFAASAVSGKYGELASARCRRQVAEKLYRMECQYFDEHGFVSVIDKINADFNEAERFLNKTFVALVSDAVAVVIYADYMSKLNAELVVQGNLSIGGHVAFILILGRLMQVFMRLLYNMADAARSIMSIQRVEEMLNVGEEPSGGVEVPLDEENVIVFDELTFGYSDGQTVLEHARFEVCRGENVVFVGDRDGERSTMFYLLCGFYRPQAGEYRLCGRCFADWDREKARGLFALVSQNIFLFPASIEENVRCGRWDASDAEVAEACKEAEIHDFIESLPMKYQTVVGERGVMLSGGQRQRIAIARAILKDAPILLLDEPPSAIDERTEAEIQRATARVRKGRTCLAFTQRLSTIRDADWIFAVKDKHIEEVGTYDQYLETLL